MITHSTLCTAININFQIPILVVGTKLDLITEVRSDIHRRSSTIAEECGADEIFLVNVTYFTALLKHEPSTSLNLKVIVLF